MADQTRDVGYYRITEAYLTKLEGGESFSIANFIGGVYFTESIYSPIISGKIIIGDTINIIDNFPIRGEEILTLTYTDFFDQSITQDFFVFGVTNLGPNDQQSGVGYQLSFMSPQGIMSMSHSVAKSYTGTTTQIINKIFNQYLVDNTLYENARYTIDTEESTGAQTIVIPSLDPLSAIDFLKRRSFSSDNQSSNYLFFQNRKQFRMVTHEKLIKDSNREDNKKFDEKKVYSQKLDIQSNIAELGGAVMNNILDIGFPKRINTVNELSNGSLTSQVVEIDILTKQYQFFPYNYKDSYTKYKHLDTVVKFPHSDKFYEKYLGDQNRKHSDMVLTDSQRSSLNYKEITSQRRSTSYYLNAGINCTMTIYGRNDLFAGDIVKLNIPEYINTEGSREMNKSLSGFWLVAEIDHSLDSDEYKFNVRLLKDLAKGGDD